MFETIYDNIALPVQIMVPSVGLMAKPAGGKRPITVTSILYMTLMQLIGDDLIDRADALTAFWGTACKGSSALSAALRRASLDELALLENKTTITATGTFRKSMTT